MPLSAAGVWRNSRPLITCLYVFAAISWAATLLVVLAAIGQAIPFHFSGLLYGCSLLGAAYAVAQFGRGFWKQGRIYARAEAHLGSDALRVRLFSGGAVNEAVFNWSDITNVTATGGFENAVTVITRDGSTLLFTSYDFILPSRLAMQIATRAGLVFTTQPAKPFDRDAFAKEVEAAVRKGLEQQQSGKPAAE